MHNIYRIYSDYEYDALSIIIQVGYIVSYTLLALDSWRRIKKKRGSNEIGDRNDNVKPEDQVDHF